MSAIAAVQALRYVRPTDEERRAQAVAALSAAVARLRPGESMRIECHDHTSAPYVGFKVDFVSKAEQRRPVTFAEAWSGESRFRRYMTRGSAVVFGIAVVGVAVQSAVEHPLAASAIVASWAMSPIVTRLRRHWRGLRARRMPLPSPEEVGA